MSPDIPIGLLLVTGGGLAVCNWRVACDAIHSIEQCLSPKPSGRSEGRGWESHRCEAGPAPMGEPVLIGIDLASGDDLCDETVFHGRQIIDVKPLDHLEKSGKFPPARTCKGTPA